MFAQFLNLLTKYSNIDHTLKNYLSNYQPLHTLHIHHLHNILNDYLFHHHLFLFRNHVHLLNGNLLISHLIDEHLLKQHILQNYPSYPHLLQTLLNHLNNHKTGKINNKIGNHSINHQIKSILLAKVQPLQVFILEDHHSRMPKKLKK